MSGQKLIRVSLGASGTADLFDNQTIRDIGLSGAEVSIRMISSTVNVVHGLFAGNDKITDADTPVSGGGTAGVFPSETQGAFVAFVADPLSKLSMPLRETAAAAAEVMAVVNVADL